MEKRKTDTDEAFYPKSDVYRRLVALWAGEDPLIYRAVRVAERASVVYSRLPHTYRLAWAGAALLCLRRGYEMGDLWYEDPRKRSLKNFEYSVAIGTFYAALRCSLEFSGQHSERFSAVQPGSDKQAIAYCGQRKHLRPRSGVVPR
jgi:hypothetical protein